MSEVQIEKPEGRKKRIMSIVIAGGIIIIGIVLFLVFVKTGEAVNSLIPVSNSDSRWGYINRKGEYVINPQFEHAGFFSETGLAKINSGGKTGYINKKGEYVIPATYKDGTAFSNGLAFVVAEGGLPTCIDKNGETRFTLSMARYVSAFSEGLAVFIAEDGKYGFVDKTGKVVINAQFDGASSFSGNFARIWQEGDAGFVDKTGRITINPQFSRVGTFSEGKAAFFNGSLWGYINAKGAYVINPQFNDAGRFNDGLATIKQGKSYGYIDKDGKLVVNPQFDNASFFSDGLAAVQSAGKYGYINKEGRYEINPQFEYAEGFLDGIALVRSADKWGLINKKGQYVVNPQFKSIQTKAAMDEQSDFIESDYYDMSEFIRLFFEKEAGNTFDGIGASTTLEQLSEHPVYGAGLNAKNLHYADYSQPTSITNDIRIGHVGFEFNDTPVYEYEDAYSGYGRTQKWNFNATPDAIVYRFDLSGKAWEKQHVVLSALKTEIERRHGQSMKSDGETFYLLPGNGKPGFTITGNELRVSFNKDYSSEKQGAQNQQQQAGSSVNIPKTSVRGNDDIYHNSPRITPAERRDLKVDHFKYKGIRTADNSNLIKGDCIYRCQSGQLNLIHFIARDGSSIGVCDFLVSYDSSGNYVDELMVGGGWIESELHSSAVIEGNKIVITYYGDNFGDDENITTSEFVIKSDLSFVKIK